MGNRNILPFFKGQVINNAECVDISNMGYGVLKPNNFTIFAKGLIVGEFADVQIQSIAKNFAIAKVVNIYNKSKDRVTHKNLDEINSNNAKYLHMSYKNQIEVKENQLEALFGYKVKVKQAKNQFNYRNKVSFNISNEHYNVYGDNNKLIPVKQSILSHDEINKIMPIVLEAINNNKKAKISGIIFRYSEYQKSIMIILVSKLDNYYADKIAQEIIGYSNKVKSVILNVGDFKNYLFNENERLLYGEDNIMDKIRNKFFKITSKSFYQVNNSQTKVLYETIIELGQFTLNDNILDLYCGVGSIALSISDYVNHVLGVELLDEAVESANQNIELNNVSNVEIIKHDLNEKLVIEDNIDCIIVDPPRSGLSKQLIQNISKSPINKMIYVSCNPISLKRDLDLLCKSDFVVKKHLAVDMFVNTEHIETVVLMSRVDE